jgi:hypothetical protein
MGDLRDQRPKNRVRKPAKLQRTRCRAHAKHGGQCRAWAILGGTVCNKHGGSAPQVKEKARQRLTEMVFPALAQLRKILVAADTSDTDRLRAIKEVLDRTGLTEAQLIKLEVSADWTTTFEGVVLGYAEQELELPAGLDSEDGYPVVEGELVD